MGSRVLTACSFRSKSIPQQVFHRCRSAEALRLFRVPAVYLTSAFLWFFSILLFRRINNLRRINPPEGFDSHPGNFLERDFWTALAVKIEVKFLLFTSNRNRARLLYVTHRRASSGKQDGNPSRHARPDGPASAAGHGPVAWVWYRTAY